MYSIVYILLVTSFAERGTTYLRIMFVLSSTVGVKLVETREE